MDFDEIMNGIQDAYRKANEQNKARSEARSSEADWAKAYQQVKDENEKIKEAAKKLLDDFDRVNTELRDTLNENQNLKAKIASMSVLDDDRKKYYNEATSLRKERTSYAKAVGAIYGALETLNKELNA